MAEHGKAGEGYTTLTKAVIFQPVTKMNWGYTHCTPKGHGLGEGEGPLKRQSRKEKQRDVG